MSVDTFQWLRCDSAGNSPVDIGGATSNVYDPVLDDLGHRLRLKGWRDAVLVGTSLPSEVVITDSPDVSPYTPNKVFDGGTGRVVDAFLASLVPGDVAGLKGICIVDSYKWRTVGGTSGAKIVVTSNSWASPATLKFSGTTQWDIRGPVGWWVFERLYIDDTQTAQPTTLACGGHDIVFRNLTGTNHNRHIGFDLINDGTYGVSQRILIEKCHLHDIGPVAYDNRSHGVYNQGIDNIVRDCIIDHCSARGIQDRAATNGIYDHNILVDNAVGIIVGDLGGSHGLRGTKNIIAYSSLAGIRTFSNAGGSDNILDDNFVFAGPVDAVLEHLVASNVHTSDPMFVNHAGRDYTLAGGSPAAGYGPRFHVGV